MTSYELLKKDNYKYCIELVANEIYVTRKIAVGKLLWRRDYAAKINNGLTPLYKEAQIDVNFYEVIELLKGKWAKYIAIV